MTNDELMIYSKIFALLLFLPIFIGVAVWAYLPGNEAKFAAQAEIALKDD